MWNEFYFFLAVFCALLVYLLDYAFGQPGGEKWNSQELLSGWSLFLAKRRLKKESIYRDLERQLHQQLISAPDSYQRKLIRKNFNQLVFQQAREVFYYEKALGMCPICFHFWVTLIVFLLVNYFYFSVTLNTFVFSILISHLIIRLLKKFI